ncbi:chemotaxis protein CheD [Ruficoccus amylovorans]|uniref:Probable chemoreceptor glutamine deamidase CheD n=1 Tax=Ruficoccus amylovorans TaxID=1804625 RepID=A0A842HEN4_9BACT|nr:chemotaxis protein CheD [Ruficoccus amylovorans]MBC2594983.1 chemotaxis protein CheD [Ruficoccus amylovorans]
MNNLLGITPKVVVGISDKAVSNHPDIVVLTYALGSCIGLLGYDPEARVVGMIHYMLADSSSYTEKARNSPCMFADTGLPMLMKDLMSFRASPKRLMFAIAGGASTNEQSDFFKIGAANIQAAEDFISRNGLRLKLRDVGGSHNRTLSFSTSSQTLSIKSPKGTTEHLLR